MRVYVEFLEPVGDNPAGSKALVEYQDANYLATFGKAKVLALEGELKTSVEVAVVSGPTPELPEEGLIKVNKIDKAASGRKR